MKFINKIKWNLPEMGLTTSITIFRPIGKNNKHQCIAPHMILIVDVTNVSWIKSDIDNSVECF